VKASVVTAPSANRPAPTAIPMTRSVESGQLVAVVFRTGDAALGHGHDGGEAGMKHRSFGADGRLGATVASIVRHSGTANEIL
jgi:hypothetical protein